jgi:hypothetical protein
MATVPGPDPNKPPPIPGAPAQEPPREDPERYEPAPRRRDEQQPDWAPEPEWTPEKEEEEVGGPTPL